MSNIENWKGLQSLNLKLSILEPDSSHQGGVVTLQRGTETISYQVMLSPCPDPRCGCGGVFFRLRHAASEMPGDATEDSDGLQEFWLDVKKKAVIETPELKEKADSIRLSNDISTALTGEDWAQLYQWMRMSKLTVIQATPLEQIDIRNLPNASDGPLVPFNEVFPWGLYFYFQMHNEIWVAEEHYCVQPECECREIILSFLKLRDAAGVLAKHLENAPAIRYDYRRETAEERSAGTPGNPPVSELLTALKHEHPHLNLQLETRHLQLQNIYLRCYLSKMARSFSSKIGRNEPCPCGSGKKFKNCCLRVK